MDFREAHSDKMMESYLSSLQLKARYWQQDLQEKVTQDLLE